MGYRWRNGIGSKCIFTQCLDEDFISSVESENKVIIYSCVWSLWKKPWMILIWWELSCLASNSIGSQRCWRISISPMITLKLQNCSNFFIQGPWKKIPAWLVLAGLTCEWLVMPCSIQLITVRDAVKISQIILKQCTVLLSLLGYQNTVQVYSSALPCHRWLFCPWFETFISDSSGIFLVLSAVTCDFWASPYYFRNLCTSALKIIVVDFWVVTIDVCNSCLAIFFWWVTVSLLGPFLFLRLL